MANIGFGEDVLVVISDNLNSSYVWDFSYLHPGQEGSGTDFEALPP